MGDLNPRSLRAVHGRSYLFAPGFRENRFDKAVQAGPDVVILDLDASVSPEHKERARDNVVAFLRASAQSPMPLLVRCNGPSTQWFDGDMQALRDAPLDGLIVPLVRDAATLTDARLPGSVPLVPLIECASALINVVDIAQAPRVGRLAFGNMDYQSEQALSGNDSLILPSSMIALASRHAGLPAPIAGVTAAYNDMNVLQADIAFEKALGFGAKLCIHPSQVEPIRRTFGPSKDEIEWALAVIAASKRSYAEVVGDKLVDRPVVERATRILADAGIHH